MKKFPFLAAALMLAATVSAQSLSGHVVTTAGIGIPNTTITLDRDALPVDTDANGNFTITGLRNGRRYTVQIDTHQSNLVAQEFDFTVNGASNLGNITMQPGTQITIQVLGPTGSPLLGANLNAYNTAGIKLFTPHDGTDLNGNGTITVPIGDFNFRVMPPVGTTYVPLNLDLTSASSTTIALGTMTMRQGYAITGSVVRSGTTPLPVANCDLVARNALTGEVVFQVNNKTNALGAMNLLLPFGLYDLELRPALGSPYAARIIYGVFVIDYPRNLGLLTCDPGVSLAGSVFGPLGVVAGADIDVIDALGHKLFTPNDNTSAAGFFSVIVPAGGTYYVTVDPPVAYGLAGGKSITVNAATSASVGIVNLQFGHAATVTVVDHLGNPVPGALAKVRDAVTNEEYTVPGNLSDAAGLIHAILPAATVNITVQAPQGTTNAPFHIGPAPIVAPFTTTIVLPQKSIWTNLSALSVLTIPNGSNLQMAWTIGNTTTQVLPFTLEAVVPLASGVEVPWIPAIPLDFPGPFALLLFVEVPMPPLAAGEMNHEQKFLIRLRNPANQQILDEAYVRYVPQ